jgi:hypothetical protein
VNGKGEQRRHADAGACHRASAKLLGDSIELPCRQRACDREKSCQCPVPEPDRAKHDRDRREREQNTLREIGKPALPRGYPRGRARVDIGHDGRRLVRR